ncbi:nucleotidyl transferase family protein [Tuwongella immobilis]|uniref:Sulfate adenylyltransferase n=1 Tax=Tuwongella immobilis TaxID=692036 RepID=A0A6C2YK69_9BACT|nr:sulfate adenylyltransferase [Tuwongella immobilis]VIP01332.1 sulfate adenylyltransferase : Sulfate adenylyltransferase OS=Planctomyces maris DSM 8797 GN=sat PE=4 SV=1: PUA_2: ATP-sulfurylase [Tuwongella immobilis]VTR98090.1 sulfate adenylyltransferase : Sulfate adenylyltransferase OS=Planctomyces maris DSM 8797 GN=sat PE=4 SV=1: PUA_2: ATP-sulfurylase [Tuwongella immobilis]
MADLIAPHGGLSALVNRTVPAAEIADFTAKAATLPKLTVSDADLSSLYRMADGGLSPLTGPMTREVFDRVLQEEVILSEGGKYAWTIPIAFPVDAEQAKTLKVGETIALVNSKDEIVGTLDLQDVYPWDKVAYNTSVYATPRMDHPGARIALSDPREYLVGGTVRVLPQPKNPSYGDLVLSPTETRALFAAKKFQRVVAFQTRNALHRAHEYALVVGLERLTREGFFTGAVLNPLVGETKSDDVDAVTRMKTYRALIDNKALGQGDTDDELWAKVGRPFSDHVLLIGLDIKMFYAGPKEAVMHAIYRQNFGFTDIIIGRKHADAPYDDKSEIWDGLAAHRKFDELKGTLLIQPVKVGFAAYYAELGRVGLVEEHAPKGWKAVSISGSELREKFRRGELPDPGVMRPETARVLIESMKGS